jgi:hypothetical protein
MAIDTGQSLIAQSLTNIIFLLPKGILRSGVKVIQRGDYDDKSRDENIDTITGGDTGASKRERDKICAEGCIVSGDICDLMRSGDIYRDANIFRATSRRIEEVSGAAEWSTIA